MIFMAFYDLLKAYFLYEEVISVRLYTRKNCIYTLY